MAKKQEKNKIIKNWKTVATFDTFEEADQEKRILLEKNKDPDVIIKIRRSNIPKPGGKFLVKFWQPEKAKKIRTKSKAKKIKNKK